MTIKSFGIIIICFFLFFPKLGLSWEDHYFACIDFCWNKNEGKIRKNRIVLALEMSEQIDNLYSYIPSPKPSTMEWIQKEVSEIQKLSGEAKVNRMNLFMKSLEYHHVRLHKHLTEIKELLELLKNKDLIIEHEIYLWSILSIKLSDEVLFRQAIEKLSKDRFLPDKLSEKNPFCYYDESTYLAPFMCRYQDWGLYIHKIIINPYLESIAMK